MSNARYTRFKTVKGQVVPLANLSQWHPDYGMSMAEHTEMKQRRAAGKVRFTPKAELKARRSRLIGR